MTGKPGRVPKNKGKGKAATFLIALMGHKGDDCITWPFAKDSRIGRGMLGYNGKHYWAHRLMCELAHGPAPTDRPQTAHSCGNGHKGCVNPNHLSWKTAKENGQDRVAHGTQHHAGWGKNGRLGPIKTAELKSRQGKQTAVATAKEFGVSLTLVQYYWGGRNRWPSHARKNASNAHS